MWRSRRRWRRSERERREKEKREKIERVRDWPVSVARQCCVFGGPYTRASRPSDPEQLIVFPYLYRSEVSQILDEILKYNVLSVNYEEFRFRK